MAGSNRADNSVPCVMVIFGASGDLVARKLIPSLYNLEAHGLLHAAFRVIGFARTEKTNDEFREQMRQAVEKYSKSGIRDDVWQRFAPRLYYLTGRYDSADDYKELQNILHVMDTNCRAQHFVGYLAVPPSVMETILQTMQGNPFYRSTPQSPRFRMMVEKPFGLDLAGARRLNDLLASMFDENHIYRIDHYIAKDTIRNLLILRFANLIFEPIWNRNYIDNVQIIAAEKIGIESRGNFYEETGVVRDIVQNHVLQVLSLVAMESPVAGNTESVQDQKLQVFKSIAPVRPEDVVYGQYRGYREVEGVSPDSTTPTFVAMKLGIDNWRWFGVPFFILAGKKLERTVTQVAIEFKQVPMCVLDSPELCHQVRPNRLVMRIQPDEGIQLTISTKSPERRDRIRPGTLDFRYAAFGMEMPEAYERVVLDAMAGDPTLFWRADGIEAAWKVVEPILDTRNLKPAIYEPGSWGPQETSRLLKDKGITELF